MAFVWLIVLVAIVGSASIMLDRRFGRGKDQAS